MTKAMVLSLGSTPEPLAKSINDMQPAAVCFLTSQQSIEVIPRVKQALTVQVRDYKVVVDNPNDLMDCYQGANKCWQWLEKEKLADESVAIDYTGGTKVMSVALMMLGIEKGCELLYVGGDERSNGGLGQVVSGRERVFQSASPWQVLAVAEQREGAAYFNMSQFVASARAFARGREMVKGGQGRIAALLQVLADMAVGYDKWDRFQHKEARETIRRACTSLDSYVAVTADAEAAALLVNVQANLGFLDALMEQSKGFQRPCALHVRDLLGNAQRRAEEGRFDDGIIRLYRALELLADLALLARGIDPNALRLGLNDCYLKLEELGDPLGQLFRARNSDFRNVQQARNYSWLEHGTQVLRGKTYLDLKDLVLALSGVAAEELPVFPRLGPA
ncbi:MAG: TIGR02710 family CRISPR-associated CARF protein [Chloroflexota bacterium]